MPELPSSVKRLWDDEFVDPRTLGIGERFLFDQQSWTVVEVSDIGIYCDGDPRLFLFQGAITCPNIPVSEL
jgi:hypothetical protein